MQTFIFLQLNYKKKSFENPLSEQLLREIKTLGTSENCQALTLPECAHNCFMTISEQNKNNFFYYLLLDYQIPEADLEISFDIAKK